MRLDIRKIATIKEGEKATGSRTRVKVAKNKCAPPFSLAEFEIQWGRGIVREAEILDAALEQGTVQKAGSWFSWGDARLGQGRAAVLDWLREHPKERDLIAAGSAHATNAPAAPTKKAA